MSSSTFDFTLYLATTLSIRPEILEVEVLPWGYTNLTARASFKNPISVPSHFGYPDLIQSVILKVAKPFMHALPSYAVPMSRQAVEARALRILQGEELDTVAQALGQSHPLKVPKLVFHDTNSHVIWMTDLGRSRILSDYILYESPQQVTIQALGRMLGCFFGGLFMATKNPSKEITRSLADSRHLLEFLTSQTERVVIDLPDGINSESTALLGRMRSALDSDVNQEQCLGMVDLWPGSVLIDDNGECGLVDWEHFGVTDPGSDLGMFAGHLHLLVLHDGAPEGTAERTTTFISTFASSYFEAHPGISARFERRFLIAHGRSLICGTNVFAEAFQESTKIRAVKAGLSCLKAAGEGTGIDHDALAELPPDIKRGVEHFLLPQEEGFGTVSSVS
ncbi:hypothetical protein FRC04_002697 [Tulasnella sp. 424]|nr:hypothetical protein FRC04_002697 [Tulasnella sp. 424]KAG8974203.1 hypothetical protein FRC05_007779 [Tulasnella sp. 425]